MICWRWHYKWNCWEERGKEALACEWKPTGTVYNCGREREREREREFVLEEI